MGEESLRFLGSTSLLKVNTLHLLAMSLHEFNLKKVNTVHKRLLKSKEILAFTVRLSISFWMVPSRKEGLTGIHLQASPLCRLMFVKPVNNLL